MNARTDRRRRLLILTALPLFFIFYDTSSRALAAEITSTGGATSSIDKAVCHVGYDPTSAGAPRLWSVVSVCNVEGGRNGFVNAYSDPSHVYANTDRLLPYLTSPQFLTVPSHTRQSGAFADSCTESSHSESIYQSVGPRAAVPLLGRPALGTQMVLSRQWCSNALPAGIDSTGGETGTDFGTGRITQFGTSNRTQWTGGRAGAMTWLGEVDFETWEGMSGPTDWYAGGGPYEDPPPEFCGASIETDLPSDAVVEDGDVVEVSTTWLTGLTGNVDIRWTTTGSSWYNVHLEGSLANPDVRNITVTGLGPGKSVKLAGAQFRCYDVTADTYWYLNYGDGDETVATDPSTLSPCKIARFYWPSVRSIDALETETWTIGYSGTLPAGYTPTTLDIEYATYDEEAAIPKLTSMTWTVATGGDDIDKPTYNQTVTATAGYDGSTRQFIFRCKDASGYTYGSQWATGVRLKDPGDADFRDESCVSSAGIGLNPSSWVPGALRMGTCVLKALFVPDQQVIDDASEALGAELGARTPTNYAAEAVPMVTGTFLDLSDAIESKHDACFTLLPSMGPDIIPNGGEIDQQGMCGEDIAQLDSWRPIASFFFWIGFAFSMLRLVGRVLDGADLTGAVGSYFRSTDVDDAEPAPRYTVQSSRG